MDPSWETCIQPPTLGPHPRRPARSKELVILESNRSGRNRKTLKMKVTTKMAGAEFWEQNSPISSMGLVYLPTKHACRPHRFEVLEYEFRVLGFRVLGF